MAAQTAAVFGGFVLLTVVVFWPWVIHLNSVLLGPPEDNLQDFWNTWYAVAGHGPHFFHTRLLYFPDGVSLYYQSFAYPQVFAVAVLSKMFGSDIPTLLTLHNATILASFPIAATGAFVLVRHFTKNQAAAGIGGFIFAFNPWHVQMAMHHAHVSGIEFIPFFVLAYLLAIERHSFGWLAAAVLLYVLSALMCWYFLFYLGYFIVFHFIWEIFRRHQLPDRWHMRTAAITLGGCALLLSPLIVPMAIEATDKTVYARGADAFGADLLAYVAPPPTHFLAGWTQAFYARLPGNAWEGTVYLGAAIITLLAWWYVRRRKTETARYVLAGIVTFWVIACGNSLHVGGYGLHFLHMPSNVLSKLPFLANVRTPSRAVVMVYLFAAIGMGAVIAFILEEPTGRRKLAAAAIALLIVVDFYPVHLTSTPAVCPPQFAMLRNDPDRDFGVVSLPGGYRPQNLAMFDQTCHGRPLAGGNTSRVLAEPLLAQVHTRAQLKQARVKYVIVRPDGAPFHWNREDALHARLVATYPHVYDGADMTILRVY